MLPSSLFYVMSDPPSSPMTILFDEWVETMGSCGPLKYTAKLSSGNALPNFITFNPSQRAFVVQQTSNMAPIDYKIFLKGALANYQMSETLQMVISAKCAVSRIQSTQDNMTITYVPGSMPIEIQILDFV